ncbi:MAG: hypothetical protein HY657_07070 [Acidobacteria bacterium]|nr:hypothetical protein [Acidobacteriota bacterium]
MLVLACLAAVPRPALAQLDNPSWGITGSFAPLWKVPEQLGELFDAETLDIRGYELRLGLVRGTTFGGEWGVTLVHKRLSKESTVAIRESSGGVISVVADDAEWLGVELHRFFAFARVGRAQIGVNLGGGLAQMRGFLTGSVSTTDGADVEAPIAFNELFELAGREIDIFPLARAELAVAALVGDRVKVRVGGGFNMPGIQLASVTVSWLLGTDR